MSAGSAASVGPVVLAAHGEGDGSEVNRQVLELAARAQMLSGRRISVAFRLGEPSWNSPRATDRRPSPPLVIPLLAAEGHFATSVLPRELGFDPGAARPPLGLHREVLDGVVDRVRLEVARQGSDADRLGILVVGHGTERHVASGNAADRMAQRLHCEFPAISALSVGFLDQAPEIESAARTLVGRLRRPSHSSDDEPVRLVIVPFLIGGAHVRRDLPARLHAAVPEAQLSFLPPLLEEPSLLPALLAELGARSTARLRLGSRASAPELERAHQLRSRLGHRGLAARVVPFASSDEFQRALHQGRIDVGAG